MWFTQSPIQCVPEALSATMIWSWPLTTIYCMHGALLRQPPYTFISYTEKTLPFMNIATSITFAITYLYENFSASFLHLMSCTIAKKCCCPTKNFRYFCSTNKKWCPKHDWIIAQSIASDRLTFVATNVISSPVIKKKPDEWSDIGTRVHLYAQLQFQFMILKRFLHKKLCKNLRCLFCCKSFYLYSG
jgi:hypothetical protein